MPCFDTFEHFHDTICELVDACKATYCHTSCSYVLFTSCIRLQECALHQVALYSPTDPAFLQLLLLTAEAMCTHRRHPQLTRKAGASQTQSCSNSAGTLHLCHVTAVLSLFGMTTRPLVRPRPAVLANCSPLEICLSLDQLSADAPRLQRKVVFARAPLSST